MARTLPDVRSAFHTMNWRVIYPVTIQDEDLKQAFDKRFPTTDDKYDFLMLKREFIFVESLYQENRISEDEYKGYIEELKKGNSVL